MVPEVEYDFKVSDVRQYVYCPRVIYFNYVIPVPRRYTVKMDHGKESHIDFALLEKRRTLSKYKLYEGKKHFHVPVYSSRLGLSGNVDMVIDSPAGLFPVEFKNTSLGMGLHHKYQLVAYAMILEEVFQKAVRTGFVYLMPCKTLYKVPITQTARTHVLRVIGAMRNLVSHQKFPLATRSAARCRDCEFKNYCRGV